ncbi:MAG: ParB N-terminal domain-containing protein [Pseudomonadota bacterium]
MSKRRRVFEIEVPEEVAVAPAPEAAFPAGNRTPDPAPAGRRRGPMATAVRESAEAVRERAETEAAVRAENDRLAHEHVRLKRLGLIAEAVPIDQIDTTMLHRDRSRSAPDPDFAELKASILDVGLSNPIRVEAAVGGRYELIQGWRRLQAYHALHVETGDERFATIPAGISQPGESLEMSYRRMVDENLVRRNVSFAEMAMLAQAYAADSATECGGMHDAVNVLFASAGKQKRAYIRAFGELLERLETSLSFPEAIPRNLGLALRRELETGSVVLAEVQRTLKDSRPKNAEEEVALLRRFVRAESGGLASAEGPASNLKSARAMPTGEGVRRTRTSFRFSTGLGEMRCTAADGKLELRGTTDFSSVERRRLEAAVAAFMAALTR